MCWQTIYWNPEKFKTKEGLSIKRTPRRKGFKKSFILGQTSRGSNPLLLYRNIRDTIEWLRDYSKRNRRLGEMIKNGEICRLDGLL